MFANKFIKNLKPYKLVSHKAWELSYNEQVLKLDWNEATVEPSPLVKQRIIEFAENGNMNWYPDVNNSQLIALLADYCGVNQQQVQYFGSSDYLHEYLVRTFIEDGDKVLIVGPTYDNFRASAESLGGIVEFFLLNERFEFEEETFINTVEQQQPKIVYLCNPNNPTGTFVSTQRLESLVKYFPEILFIIDEAYYEFTEQSAVELISGYNNLIITRTFSKAFGLASLRIGYALSCEENIKLLTLLRNAKNINQFAQIAAIAVLEDVGYMHDYVREVKLAREAFIQAINNTEDKRIRARNGDGNFVLLEISSTLKLELIAYLEEHRIFIRNYGHVNTMENFVRVTIGTQLQMEIVSQHIHNFLLNENCLR